MVDYRDSDGNIVMMEEALGRSSFTVSWVDAEIECVRRGSEEVWWISRTVNGIKAGQGSITRSNFAFYRSGSAYQYNTFDEAAREIIKPV